MPILIIVVTLSPTIFPPENLQYTLTATSNVGCGIATSIINIKVYKDIFIPNAFTPNGDGINDKFKITAADNYKVKKLLIYNRWGELLYMNTNFKNGWDGTFKRITQPVGSYIYYLETQSPTGKSTIKKGMVSLLK